MKVIKIPKLPMVEYAKKWYRAKVLKDAGSKVLLEYQGYSHEGGPFWLPKDHPRIWRGSYKGRDWKYLVGVRASRTLSCSGHAVFWTVLHRIAVYCSNERMGRQHGWFSFPGGC